MPKPLFPPLDELASFALLPDSFYPGPVPLFDLFPMPARISADDCREYLETREKRLEHDRQSAALKVREDELAEKFEDYLDEREKTSAKVANGAFELCFTDGAADISWKHEFIKQTSPEKAAQVLTGAPKRRKLNVVDLLTPAAA